MHCSNLLLPHNLRFINMSPFTYYIPFHLHEQKKHTPKTPSIAASKSKMHLMIQNERERGRNSRNTTKWLSLKLTEFIDPIRQYG